MPAAKKPSAVRRRTKPATASTKSPRLSTSKSATKSIPMDSPKIVTGKPLPNPYPASTTLTPSPMPMPVEPERMPSRLFTPMVRTTYNSTWLRRAGIGVGILIITGIGYTAWTFRDSLPTLFTSPQPDTNKPVTQLTISPTPTPRLDRLNQLSSGLLPQASASAQEIIPIDQASSSAQLSQHLQDQSSADLKIELDRYMTDLDQQHVNLNNLKAYRDKVESLEKQGQSDAAHQWLVEAVLHAHELAILHGYYGN